MCNHVLVFLYISAMDTFKQKKLLIKTKNNFMQNGVPCECDDWFEYYKQGFELQVLDRKNFL